MFDLVPRRDNFVSMFAFNRQANDRIWVGGVQIIENMIQFDDHRDIVDAICKCPHDDLLQLARHPAGSYMLELFFKTSSVDREVKDLTAEM